MAAQRLTKGRVIQIIVMLIILIIAFTWRTVLYQSDSYQCEHQQICVIPFAGESLKMSYSAPLKHYQLQNPNQINIRFIAGQGKIVTNQNTVTITLTTPTAIITLDDDKMNKASITLKQ